jgi:hypothetical protein
MSISVHAFSQAPPLPVQPLCTEAIGIARAFPSLMLLSLYAVTSEQQQNA